MLGFAEMVMLSMVSYLSLSLVLIIITIFGPTNSTLVECTSLVTSILFSYYFISSGGGFVFVHSVALLAFLAAMMLNVYGISKHQFQQKEIEAKHIVRDLEEAKKLLQTERDDDLPKPAKKLLPPRIPPVFSTSSDIHPTKAGEKEGLKGTSLRSGHHTIPNEELGGDGLDEG